MCGGTGGQSVLVWHNNPVAHAASHVAAVFEAHSARLVAMHLPSSSAAADGGMLDGSGRAAMHYHPSQPCFPVTADAQGSLYQWNVTTGARWLIGRHPGLTNLCAWPDGECIASFALDDRKIRLWHVRESRVTISTAQLPEEAVAAALWPMPVAASGRRSRFGSDVSPYPVSTTSGFLDGTSSEACGDGAKPPHVVAVAVATLRGSLAYWDSDSRVMQQLLPPLASPPSAGVAASSSAGSVSAAPSPTKPGAVSFGATVGRSVSASAMSTAAAAAAAAAAASLLGGGDSPAPPLLHRCRDDGGMWASSAVPLLSGGPSSSSSPVVVPRTSPDLMRPPSYTVPSWAPDGSYVAAGRSVDSALSVVHVATRSAWVALPPTAGTDRLSVVRWGPRSEAVAAGCRQGGVFVWTAASSELQAKLLGHAAAVLALAWVSPAVLVSSSDDLSVRVWDAATGRPLRCLYPLARPVVHMCWSTAANALLVATSSEKCVRVLAGVTDSLASVAMPSAGDASPGPSAAAHAGAGAASPLVRSATLLPSPHGSGSGAADGAADGEPPACPTLSVALSSDRTRVAAVSKSRVQVWDVSNCTIVADMARSSTSCAEFTVASWSPDGTQVAVGCVDGSVAVWDAMSGTCITSRRLHTTAVQCLVWSPAPASSPVGHHSRSRSMELPDMRAPPKCTAGVIASGSTDDVVALWTPSKKLSSTSCVIVDWHGPKAAGGVKSVCWAPSGTQIVAGYWDGESRVWEADSGRLARTLSKHATSVNAVSWSPCGNRIATASSDMTVKLWRVRTGQCFLTLPHPSKTTAVCWSPAGTEVAVVTPDDDVLRVWDVTHTPRDEPAAGCTCTPFAAVHSRLRHLFPLDGIISVESRGTSIVPPSSVSPAPAHRRRRRRARSPHQASFGAAGWICGVSTPTHVPFADVRPFAL